MKTHTPGPWEVSDRLNAQDFDAEAANVVLIKGRRWDIAYAAHLASDGNPAEQEANAKLIAAAPELLEALIQAEEGLRTSYQVCDYPANGNSTQDHALSAVRDAIAKATA